MTFLEPPQKPQQPKVVSSNISEATEKDWQVFFTEQENLDYLREFNR
jgi:hypothetical protein